MSSKWGWLMLAAALTALSSGCAEKASLPVTSEAAYHQVVSEGLLAEIVDLEIKASDYDLSEVMVGTISRNLDVSVQLFSPKRMDLYFKNDGGRLKEIYVAVGDEVKKGDVLAEIIFEPEYLASQKEQLLLRTQRFEQEFALEKARRENEITQHQSSTAPGMSEIDLTLHALQTDRLKLEYEAYLYNSELTRTDYRRQMEDIDEKLAGEQLVAPYDGVIRYVNNIKENNVVRSWTRMMHIEDNSQIWFVAEGAIDVLRYGDIFTVETTDKQYQFEVQVVYDPLVADTRDSQYYYVLAPVDGEALMQLLRENQANLSLMQNVRLVGRPSAFSLEQTLIAPRQAIRQEDTKQYVYLYEDGVLKKRYVKTDLYHQDDIQILEGLTAGQMVVLN